jgi:hypothetical protein
MTLPGGRRDDAWLEQCLKFDFLIRFSRMVVLSVSTVDRYLSGFTAATEFRSSAATSKVGICANMIAAAPTRKMNICNDMNLILKKVRGLLLNRIINEEGCSDVDGR